MLHKTRMLTVCAMAVITMAAAQVQAAYAILNIGNSWATDLKARIVATGLIPAGQIDVIAVGSTPSLATLQTYRAIVTTGNSSPTDPVSLGNVLADYVDQGGGVVTMIFGYAPSYIAGRWTSSSYSAFPDLGYTNSPNGTHLGTVFNPSKYPANLIFAGVNTLIGTPPAATGYYNRFTAVTPGAQAVATWSDGYYLAALKTFTGNATGYVIGLSLPSASTVARSDWGWDASTDGGRLVANSLLFTVIPEPSTLGLLGLAGLALARRRRG